MKNMFLKFDKNNKDAGLSNEIFETNFFYEYENFDFFGPINRVNIFVGANNSGKSRLLRGILKNKNQILLSSISIYNILYSIRRINKEIMSKMREDNEEIVIDFDFEKLNPTEQRQFHKEFLNLEKGNDLSCRIKRDGYIFKIVFNIIYFGEKFHNDLFTTWLNYNNESRKDNFIKLINHHKLILDFISKWETRIRTTSRKIQLYLKLLLELASWLEKFKKAIEETKITLSNYNKIYIPVLRTASSLFGNENNKINYDIFKTSISTNYKINLSNESSIELSTGLDFYNSIKRIRNDFKPKRKKFENFENFISENFFNNNPVDIVAKESDDQKEKNIIIHFEEEDEEREIHNLGDGIQSIIMLMFPIFTAEDKSWIFIEEPEVNLHPGLQRLFLEQLMNNEIIKKKELTIFFSTHSNHLLDISLTNEKGISIFTFEKQKKKEEFIYKIRNVKSDDLDILNKLEVNNSSVFLANCSIWVEGVTDRKYIKAFLQLFYHSDEKPDIEFMEDINYAFFEYAGSNLKHYLFTNENKFDEIKAQFLSNRIFLIADKDVDKGEKHKYLSEQQSENFCYKVLNVREIENILSPEILKKILKKFENINENKLEKSTIKMSDYKNKSLGKFINDKFAKVGKTFSAESETLATYYKNRFADIVLNREIEIKWKDLSTTAKNLIKEIYGFIKKHNQHL